jgi:hypothetical protein
MFPLLLLYHAPATNIGILWIVVAINEKLSCAILLPRWSHGTSFASITLDGEAGCPVLDPMRDFLRIHSAFRNAPTHARTPSPTTSPPASPLRFSDARNSAGTNLPPPGAGPSADCELFVLRHEGIEAVVGRTAEYLRETARNEGVKQMSAHRPWGINRPLCNRREVASAGLLLYARRYISIHRHKM